MVRRVGNANFPNSENADHLAPLMRASILIALAWLALLVPLLGIWRRWRNSALRYALAWAILASATNAAVASVWALLAWPVRYAALLLALAVPVAIFGARLPGTLAWNWVVVAFITVGLLPVIEQPWHSPDWHLDGPHWLLLATVLLAGWLNYLPTRLWLVASALAWALVWQLALLTIVEDRPAWLPWAEAFTVGGLFLAAVVAVARLSRAQEKLTPSLGCQHTEVVAILESFQRTWYRLRDGWGLVWAWRIREMVQSAARNAKLPGEMLWSGLCMESGGIATSGAATTTKPATIAQAPDLATRARPADAERLFAVREWCRLLQTVARRFAPPD